MSAVATPNTGVGFEPATRPPKASGDGRSRPQVISGALLTLAAAAIHFAVAPSHLGVYAIHGVFFICLGLVQVGLAGALLFAARRSLLVGAAAGTAAVIGLWLASRTVGMPLAPVPWTPEPIGFTDFAATLLEAISLLLFLLLIRAPRRPRRRGRIRVALSSAPAFLLAALLGFLGVGAGLTPMPAAFNAAPEIPGQASTSVASLVAAAGNEPLKTFTLTAGVTTVAGKAVWAYNGTVPGPELRVTKGDRVRVTLVNHLPKPTTIHWHGLRLPNAEDGVAGLTQNAVPPGSSFSYEFVASDAGTFWYHSHQDPLGQITRGLFGAFIVAPEAGRFAELRDYSLLVHNLKGGDAIGVNGTPNAHLAANAGDTVRLRVINGVLPGLDGAPLTPVLLGVPYKIAALDGHDLNTAQELLPQRIPLGMGQRADLVFTMPADGAVTLVVTGTPPLLPFSRAVTASVTLGTGSLPRSIDVSRLPRFDLTSYGTPAPDPIGEATHFDVSQTVLLGGGPAFRNGSFDFTDTFNGVASPFAPPIRVREGDLVRLHIVNSSPKSHPIHIHGHVFTILARNGRPLTGSPVHVDAVLVSPNETWDVAFRADNPGIWMLHCHVLGHAAAGMSMTMNYEGVSTPFSMGLLSGNIPE